MLFSRILIGTLAAIALVSVPNVSDAKISKASHRHHAIRKHHATTATPGNVYRDLSERANFYISQKTGYTCGPSSIAMAIADHVLHHLPSEKLVKQLTKETGTRPSDGMPDWWIAVPPVAAKHGLNTKAYLYNVGDTTVMDALDAELLQGHSAIIHVNNPRTAEGEGHFIYVAGITTNGGYVLGNPDEPANWQLGHDQEVSRDSIMRMMVMYPKQHPTDYRGQPGFMAVW